MPRLNDKTLDTQTIKGSSFTYSAAKLDALEATEYTLVSILCDVSGSVNDYKDELEKCLKEIVKACVHSPRVDNLMIRLITFSTNVEEEHGFKLLSNCNPDDYIGLLNIRDMTALYDASYNGIVATADYAKTLVENDYSVNSIIFVLTDGLDNRSAYGPAEVGKALKDTIKAETLESLVSVLIGVGVGQTPEVDQYLETFKNQAGFTQYVKIDEANSKTLAKLAEFVSKSISSQSQSLGGGSASNQISLTI
jgi:uncharacterized protein YegL